MATDSGEYGTKKRNVWKNQSNSSIEYRARNVQDLEVPCVQEFYAHKQTVK